MLSMAPFIRALHRIQSRVDAEAYDECIRLGSDRHRVFNALAVYNSVIAELQRSQCSNGTLVELVQFMKTDFAEQLEELAERVRNDGIQSGDSWALLTSMSGECMVTAQQAAESVFVTLYNAFDRSASAACTVRSGTIVARQGPSNGVIGAAWKRARSWRALAERSSTSTPSRSRSKDSAPVRRMSSTSTPSRSRSKDSAPVRRIASATVATRSLWQVPKKSAGSSALGRY